MASELDFIQLQLWVVIGLLLFFIISNVLCHILGCGETKAQRFGEMYDKGEIDKLLKKAESRLRERPHDIGALYFGANAMMAKGRHKEARANLERVSLIEPSLKELCAEEIAAIDRASVGS